MSEFAGAYLGVTLFLIVLAIVWILLPFAIFGTKPKLDELIRELRKVNAQLVEATSLLRAHRAAGQEVEHAPAPAPAPAPKGPLGACPNCDALIPLSSSQCPKCEAQFGAGSDWQVKPV